MCAFALVVGCYVSFVVFAVGGSARMIFCFCGFWAVG